MPPHQVKIIKNYNLYPPKNVFSMTKLNNEEVGYVDINGSYICVSRKEFDGIKK